MVAVSCIYSLYHHARPARARPPASSAAYQLFSAVHDLATVGLYAFGAVVVHGQAGGWTTLLGGGNGDGDGGEAETLVREFLAPAEYHTLIAAGGLHLASLGISGWLALVFRRIARMPPDMNPLEDHLTRRAGAVASARHKRNKSSVATTATWVSVDSGNSSGSSSSAKRVSARLEDYRRSGAPCYADDDDDDDNDDSSRASPRPLPSIPFTHTRAAGSRDSLIPPAAAAAAAAAAPSATGRDSRVDLPSRQYQIVPGNGNGNSNSNNTSPVRKSAMENAAKRMSAPPPSSAQRQRRDGYAGVPPREPRPASVAGLQQVLRGNNNNNNGSRATPPAATTATTATGIPRAARFTETWHATDSLVGRTQERLLAAEQKEHEEQEQKQKQKQRQMPKPKPKPKQQVQQVQKQKQIQIQMLKQRNGRAYEAIAPLYGEDSGDDDGRGSDREDAMMRPDRRYELADYSEDDDDDDDDDEGGIGDAMRNVSMYPDPLRAHPPSSSSSSSSTGRQQQQQQQQQQQGGLTVPKSGSRLSGGRNRDSSIQSEGAFYSRPYGDLKPATPPIMMVGGVMPVTGVVASGSPRQVSSGHDYYSRQQQQQQQQLQQHDGIAMSGGEGNYSYGGGGARTYRRNVSGKVAEEGMAGPGDSPPLTTAGAGAGAGAGNGYSRTLLKGFMASMST